MFCRRPSTLPSDPTFPADLEKLGYFITRDSLVRNIEHPEEGFRFYITNSERHNEVHREAFHECIRREILQRLSALGLHPLYIPSLSTTKPDTGTPHLPILSTSPPLLRLKRHVFVIMNQLFEDLGVLSYRVLSREGGLDRGSAVCFIKELLARFPSSGANNGAGDAGFIILNPGQLLYSYRSGTAMTPTSWNAKARKSAVHPMPAALLENHIPMNATVEEHLAFVFDKILSDEKFVAPDAEIYFVGLGDGGNELVKFLEKNWSQYGTCLNIRALALTAPLPILLSTSHIPLTNDTFLNFLSSRAQAWTLSSEPLNEHIANATPLSVFHTQSESGPSDGKGAEVDEEFLHLCPYVSGGEELYAECVMTTAYEKVAEWFLEIAGAR